jgi:hypothetical protein
MERIIGEDDIKGLEEEIDSAVDRLFVEKKGSAAEKITSLHPHGPVKAPERESRLQSTPEPVKALDRESLLESTPEPIKVPERESRLQSTPEPMKAPDRESRLQSTSEPVRINKSFEQMETQLLSLEWEITKGNLEKTREEVLTLKEILKERTDITSVLNLMEKALGRMIRNDENIQPQQIKFLLDSKETIKLLMKKETEGEIHTYKQLAFGGIKARFLCMEGLKETRANQTSDGKNEESDKGEIYKKWEKQTEGILNKMQLFLEKMNGILNKFEQHVSNLEQVARKPSEKLPEKRSVSVEVTVFEIDKKLFGIESNKVFKLFKAPANFQEKYSRQQKIRLKDFEMKVVDLHRLFSIERKGSKGEMQLLIAKEDGEYWGLMVDQVIRKLSVQADVSEDDAENLLGMFHWNYQEHPIDIPILNLKKIH